MNTAAIARTDQILAALRDHETLNSTQLYQYTRHPHWSYHQHLDLLQHLATTTQITSNTPQPCCTHHTNWQLPPDN